MRRRAYLRRPSTAIYPPRLNTLLLCERSSLRLRPLPTRGTRADRDLGRTRTDVVSSPSATLRRKYPPAQFRVTRSTTGMPMSIKVPHPTVAISECWHRGRLALLPPRGGAEVESQVANHIETEARPGPAALDFVSRTAADLSCHSGVRIIRISSLVSPGPSRSLPGPRPVTCQPSRA